MIDRNNVSRRCATEPARLLQLKAAKVRERFELLDEQLLIFERIVDISGGLGRSDGAHKLHPRIDKGRDHLRHVRLQLRRHLSFEVGHRGDQP